MEQNEVSRLSKEVARLNARVSNLETLIRAYVQAQGASVTPPPQPAEPVQQQPAAPPPPPPAPAPPPAAPPRPAPAPRPTTDLEAEIGGNWMNKIAAVAIVLGVAFFLKYAIDNRWINETGRIIIGIVVGLACLYGGEHFQKREMPKYAQGITGAGIAILYFSIYAAFAFYSLIDQVPAFAFMIVVTATAIALAVRHDAITIAVLGIIGGFATPILMQKPSGGTGGAGTEIQLLTYIAILDLGILAITYYKNWRTLNLLSFLGTVAIFGGWAYDNYEFKLLGPTMFFLTVFYLIFAAQSFVQNVVAWRPMNSSDIVMAVTAPVVYFGTAYYLLMDKYHIYLGMFAVAMGAVYLLLSQRVRIVGYEDRKLRLLFLAVAAAFLIVAIPIQLKQYWITIGWAAEAAVLVWLGFYVESSRTRAIGMWLLGLVAVRLLLIDTRVPYGIVLTPFFNARFAAFLFSVAMIGLVAWFYQKHTEAVSTGEKSLQVTLVVAANYLLIWAMSAEVLGWVGMGTAQRYGDVSAESIALSALWSLYAAALLAVGIMRRYRPARIMAMILFGIVIAKSFIYDVWTLERLYRIIAFIGLGVVLLVVSYVYQSHRQSVRDIMGVEGEQNAS